MKKFIFLYKGFETPTPEIGKAWMDWFEDKADHMIDSGNPMSSGVEVTKDSTTEVPASKTSFTGYSIVSADSMEEAIEIAKTNPMITSVVVYELGRM